MYSHWITTLDGKIGAWPPRERQWQQVVTSCSQVMARQSRSRLWKRHNAVGTAVAHRGQRKILLGLFPHWPTQFHDADQLSPPQLISARIEHFV